MAILKGIRPLYLGQNERWIPLTFIAHINIFVTPPKINPREETLDFCLLQCDNLDRICWKSWLWLSDWLFLQKFYFSGRKTGISRSQPIKPGNLETLLLLFSWLRAIFLMNYFAIFMPLKQSLCKYIFSLW